MTKEEFKEARELLKKIDLAKSKIDQLTKGSCALVDFRDNTILSFQELNDLGVIATAQSVLELEISKIESEFEKL
ncbi:hypothetical protein [Sphingobacterium sp. BIGb0116]|uniref:hypothetical protein n=1 Tax=Sphingobacterium sp. BIGb0116 TaxID=2940619 RepID=UPI002167BECC|nr:hypothetical protein [Sphingobacterium sp. BIGb0116]MCS4164439.1 hypothetical protein [Sphingobacterium sp. BIGb0116]